MINEHEGKLIVIDWNVFVYSAIHGSKRPGSMSSTYVGLSMIISCLRKIGIEPQDTIYLATDFLKSWRKQYSKEYKANRKALREAHTDIDWDKEFKAFNQLLKDLNQGTDWIVLQGENLEADDIASYIVRNNKEKEIILVTIDSDWQQLWQFGENIKIFSPKMKPRRYKIKPQKYNFALELAKKIKCEKSDNLISKIVTEEDYETRKMLVDLTELPEFIDKQIKDILDNISEKESINSNNIPYDALRERIESLYNDKEHIVTYDWTVGFEERKKKRTANKKRKVKK